MTAHRVASTAARTTATAAAFAGLMSLTALPALAQTAGDDTQYSYKRPSPTTITTFGSLVDLCNTPESSMRYDENHGVCVGYFSGFVDLYLAETPVSSRVVCLPNPPTTRQEARNKFVAWASSHPDMTAQPAAVGVYRFLAATYPCASTAPTVAPPAPLASPAGSATP
ncbi:Rap1a/Tai family immunity protein [Rhizosaccharibacter radicis]|uniref:Rap1a immunity protein domain-containing protein n=1 Tax=Rhizosaccharibacter radicis TaxID=2782605 RepID=A0ABT1W1H6_9PROT|nr:hypothetical protein [Acetobacteraceae bacterium KSS12]